MASHTYVCVKGSLHSTDCSVFGLIDVETQALEKRFQNSTVQVINGVLIKAGSPVNVVNALSQLGYRVVSTTGEGEIVWTMEREL